MGHEFEERRTRPARIEALEGHELGAEPQSSELRRSKMLRKWGASHSRGLSRLLLLVLVCSNLRLSMGEMLPLLGGTMKWQVSTEFMNGDRTVEIKMTTTMEADQQYCTYLVGESPLCENVNQAAPECFLADTDTTSEGYPGFANNILKREKCIVAERHGVMCISQLVPDGTSGTYRHYLSTENAQCAHTLNKHLELTMWSAADFPGEPEDDIIGEVNEFIVDYILDQDDDSAGSTERDRKRNNLAMVTGSLTKTITVVDEAVAVVAWLAPRTGFANQCRERGLLLESCADLSNAVDSDGVITATADSGKPCTANIEALERTNTGVDNDKCPLGARDIHTSSRFKATDSFWYSVSGSFVDRAGGQDSTRAACFTSGGCFQAASPALETFIPLCAVTGTQGLCTDVDFVLENYYSPVTAIPHIIETTVTDLDGTQPRYGSPSVASPHEGFAPQLFDLDGQATVLYSPELLQDLRQDNEKDTPGTTGKFRMDCSLVPEIEVTGSVNNWQAASAGQGPTGCLEGFDFDSDAAKRKGSYLKLDFAIEDALEYVMVTQTSTDNNPAANSPSVKKYDPSTTTRPVFTQHYINTLDRRRSQGETAASNQVYQVDNNYRAKAGLVQNIFSVHSCYSGQIGGVSNLPPRFVTSENAIHTDTDLETSFECPFWQKCEIDLYVKDFDKDGIQTSQGLFVEGAVGFTVAEGALTIGPDFTQDCFTTQGGSLHCRYTLQDELDGRFYLTSAIGKMFSICLVAYDIPGAAGNRCPSTPYCFKMQIVGTRPKFTQLASELVPSRNDDGEVITNQYDHPACEGFPMNLEIEVEDDVPDVIGFSQDPNKRFRVFVYDKNAETPTITDLYDPDFFDREAPSMNFDVNPSVECGADFAPYNASRVGLSPALQDRTLIDEAEPRRPDNFATAQFDQQYRYSVRSEYNPDFEYVTSRAKVNVQFNPKIQDRNGVTMRLSSTCSSLAYSAPNQRCREKLVNQDQVICAVGYDNTRSTTKRWVGVREPTDMSQGDYASTTRCWKILMESPPVFITDPNGMETPFADWATVGTSETTDDPSSYQTLVWPVGRTNTFSFVAQDPNAEDRVEIFVLASPGIPDGMEVGESKCIVRDTTFCDSPGEHCISRGMCGMDEDTFVAGKRSDCSRASRSLSWNPGSETAGREFRICAVARDDSTSCFYDDGPPLATLRGWFGEQHCVIIHVAPLTVQFSGAVADGTPPSAEMSDPGFVTVVKGYVGCEATLTVAATDVEVPAGTDAYGVTAILAPNALPGATSSHSGNAVTAMWTPSRGMEGQSFDLCFAADDLPSDPQLDILPEPLTHVCLGGPENLQGCRDGSECTEGGKCVPACIRIEVQRCEYCVQEAETLIFMVQKFQLETNWFKLWALNSYQGTPDTQFLPGSRFPTQADDADKAYFKDPDLLMESAGAHRFVIGPTYRAVEDDTILGVAARFRTTVKTLMSVNPDIDEESFPMGSSGTGSQMLCILPCTLSTN